MEESQGAAATWSQSYKVTETGGQKRITCPDDVESGEEYVWNEVEPDTFLVTKVHKELALSDYKALRLIERTWEKYPEYEDEDPKTIIRAVLNDDEPLPLLREKVWGLVSESVEDDESAGVDRVHREGFKEFSDTKQKVVCAIEDEFGFGSYGETWTVRELSDASGVSKDTTRRYVHDLKDAGWVEKVNRTDNGMNLYKLTKSRFKGVDR